MKSQHQALNRKSFDNFADRFSFIREKRGLSLGALADGKPSTAKSWEGGTMPRNDLWEGIAAKLGVSVSLLFVGEPKSQGDYEFLAKYRDEIAIPGRIYEPSAATGGMLDGVVEESQASYGDAAGDIRALLEKLIQAANGDSGRLGWIREQMRQHLIEPRHWGMKERVLQEALEQSEQSHPSRKSPGRVG